MSRRRDLFRVSDVAQQVVGGILLAGPFVVTEEVWTLAAGMAVWHVILTVAIVFGIGYGALYAADASRDPEEETEVGGIPLRFVSLIVVSYSSVGILVIALDAPATFDAPLGVTLKVVSIGSVFSVIGAATADSLF